MPLRDFYCLTCETVRVDMVVPMETVELQLHCRTCDAVTDHAAVCNGGTGKRWRYLDPFSSDPEDYKGDIQTSLGAYTVNDKTGEKEDVKMNKSARRVQDKFNDPDRKGDRYDRRLFALKKRQGRNPIWST